MKVYIGVCGIGMGHAGRCKAIGKYLEKKGVDVVFSTYSTAYDYLSKDFETLYSPDILWEEKKDGTPDPYGTLLKGAPLLKKFLSQVRKEKAHIKRVDPDVILSDSRYSTLLAGGEKGIPSLFLTNQTKAVLPNVLFKKQVGGFFTWAWSKILKYAEKILIPDLPYPYSLCATSLNKKNEIVEKYRYVGFCSRKYPREFPSKKKLIKELGLKEPFVLITISGPGKSKRPILSYFKQNLKNVEEVFVLLNEGNVEEDFERRKENFIHKGWINKIYKYIKASDLVVSRAGLSTLSDLVIYGKKSILIPMKNQPEQEGNAKNANRLGISKILKQKELYNADIKEMIKECLNNKELERNVSELQRMSRKNKGVENVSKEIFNLKSNKN